jgi:cellulose synthase/poly-beta-1,6-N-acetylglucosamine synthase-like glycosyltransferase
MASIFVILFWLSVGLLIYHLFGYPALLALLVSILKPQVQHREITPPVTVIIPSYNEGGVIQAKLLTVLNSQYPASQMEVICTDDGSTDDTMNQIRSVADPRVILDHQPERTGKMAALNRAVHRAVGEFVIISDATAFWRPDTLSNLMSNFAEPRVGCVSGRIILTGAGTAAEANENLYWRYDSWIKSQESRLGSTVTASGSLLAVRRAIYSFPDPQIINDDFQIVLNTIEQGYRVLYDPNALTIERGSSSMAEEYGRKSRIAAGRWQLAGKVLKLAPNYPGFVFKFISHKFLRLLVMPLMILAFISNLAVVLANQPPGTGIDSLFKLSPPWGQLFLTGQILLYLLAAFGALLEHFGVRFKPIYFIYYFVSSQIAILTGLVKLSSGRQSVLWRKAAR